MTYRHEVRTTDPAAAPAVFDKPAPNETPSDATDHARERAALRRVAQELRFRCAGYTNVDALMRHHADANRRHTTHGGLRACPHVRTVSAGACASATRADTVDGLGALLVSVATAAVLWRQ
ncbi:hypothetical protein GCM10023063_49730 [Arthrobacter methylotrophus]|uniref:hypothetical protein n=1 Tax=Arthrobacter methylotrophus TaxID=121291 RepID=UPI0031F14CD8